MNELSGTGSILLPYYLLIITLVKMKRLLSLIAMLFVVSLYSFCQPAIPEPFADAVPYRIKSPTSLFLTNQEAEAVKNYFGQPEHIQPEKVEILDEGFYHGYRLCYNQANCINKESRSAWIKIYTINTNECIKWYEDVNPEFLMVPFQNIKEIPENKNGNKDNFTKAFDRYKYLSCRLYRQSKDSEGETESELSLVLNKYYTKINTQSGQMLVSGARDVYSHPVSSLEYNWNLWMQCLEEIDDVGYITLIEYSEIPTSESAR